MAIFVVAALSSCARVDTQLGVALSQSQTVPTAANYAPVIGGTPSLTAIAGTPYSFQPVAADRDGDTLSFSIENKPNWATFSITSGALGGTPSVADVGIYAGVLIRVSDGATSVTLGPFNIDVRGGSPATSAPSPGTGTALLRWSPPTQNTDGSPLTDLAGYWVYSGSSAGTLSRSVRVPDPAAMSYQVTGLGAGTYFFAVAAINIYGMESNLSNTGSKTIAAQ